MSWSLRIGDEQPVDGQTYNLSAMWRLAGVIEESTKELDNLRAGEIVVRARRGLVRAVEYPEAFTALNPPNGWGDYEGFVEILFKLWRVAAAVDPTTKAAWSG